jgi:hypothetical protein
MKRSTVVQTSLVLATLMLSAGAAHAADACRNVKFKFLNEKNHAVTVLSVKYFNLTNNQFQTELIKNVTCAAGATCTTKGDNLRDTEGEDISRVVFVLKNEGGENRHNTPSKATTDPNKCVAGKLYDSLTIAAED